MAPTLRTGIPIVRLNSASSRLLITLEVPKTMRPFPLEEGGGGGNVPFFKLPLCISRREGGLG